MRYGTVIPGRFVDRPNRFVAHVETAEGLQTVHVKNTGRCRELLLPGAPVYLERGTRPGRKTLYDLIAVEKGAVLINMDAQAPNRVFGEWVQGGGFLPEVTAVRPEFTYGESRLDFCLETRSGPHLARFPDAPTERGVKHIRELQRAAEAGMGATLFFVVQMEGVRSVAPNDATHPAFGEALREAAGHGVRVCAWDCRVTPESIAIRCPVPVIL